MKRLVLLLSVGLMLAGCATEQHFYAKLSQEAEDIRAPVRTIFSAGDTITFVASGDGFAGKSIYVKVMRKSDERFVFTSPPIVMEKGKSHWWATRITKPDKYAVSCFVEGESRPWGFEITVLPR